MAILAILRGRGGLKKKKVKIVVPIIRPICFFPFFEISAKILADVWSKMRLFFDKKCGFLDFSISNRCVFVQNGGKIGILRSKMAKNGGFVK